MKQVLSLLVFVLFLVPVSMSEAVETRIIVRAKSKDAKFVGTSMGGARVVITETETGRKLSEGLTSGTTGDTRRIMMEPKRRDTRLADGLTAKYEAVVDINEPTLVTIEVEAPMARQPDMIKSSTQLWMIPGRDILGDGVVIEVPGFSVAADAPAEVRMEKGAASVPVAARIVMI